MQLNVCVMARNIPGNAAIVKHRVSEDRKSERELHIDRDMQRQSNVCVMARNITGNAAIVTHRVSKDRERLRETQTDAVKRLCHGAQHTG
jgi:hypothetical protein